MFKIVHLDTGSTLRGGQQQLLMLARALRQRGHQQMIVCGDGSALELQARQEGFRVFSLQAHDPGRAHASLQLRQQLLGEPFEILHAHDGHAQTISWLASVGMPVRRVASRRVTFLPGGVRWHRLKYTYSCHAVIAVSDFVRQLLAGSGVPPARIEVIPDGIELPPGLPSVKARSRIRAQWGFSETDFLVGHVGYFTPEKGQEIAIEAVMRLADRLPRARLLLAGDGPLLSSPKIREAVRQAEGRVRLLGYLEDLSEFFAGLDLFVMPSKAEGLGSSALLAMSHGLAVVATRVGGLPEIIEEGKTGWLVPPESPSALGETIVAAASDPARLRRFGQNARERARQFSSDIMIERTVSLYRRLLAHRNNNED